MSRLIALSPTADPHRFALDVTPQVSVGHPDRLFLFGGAGMGAAVAAMEAATGRPAVWATAQYLAVARPPSRLDLAVAVAVAGHRSSQARVTGRVSDTEILSAAAALGVRPGTPARQWATMPAVPPPDDCPPLVYTWVRRDDDVNGQFDQHLALGPATPGAGEPPGDGTSAMWVRPRAGGVDRVTLAVIADFLPAGVGRALGAAAVGNSLDNTIRFLADAPTEWVLCDMAIEAMANGFAHGRMRLFAQSGALLATASQSMIVRLA